MVAYDLVMELALPDGRPIEASPALTGGIERALYLVEDLLCPVLMEP